MKNEILYKNIVVKEQGNSEVLITGEISEEMIPKYRPLILKKLGKNMELPGFRKGNIPEKVMVDRLGEQAILNEIAEAALQDAYPKIVAEEKLNVIGQPEVQITKLASGNPIEFSITTALLPEVTLPNYTKIAQEVLKEKDELEVTEKDVDTVIDQILKSQKDPQATDKEKEGKPVLTDELVKTLGEFENIADFKEKLTENLKQEKKRKAQEKKRVLIGEKIIEESTIPLPRLLVESELEKMMAQFQSDIERTGLKLEDYLKQIKKTKEEVQKEWEKDAEKRAKLQLILNKIASEENIRPQEEVVDREVKHIIEHVSGAEPQRVKIYVETMITNEEVFRFLEGQKKEDSFSKKEEK